MWIEINEKVHSLRQGGGLADGGGAAAAGGGSEAECEAGRVMGRREALAEMFGVGLDEDHTLTLYDRLRVEICGGEIVYVTGASGSGKSVLMRALERKLRGCGEGGGCAGGGGSVLGPVAVLDDVDCGGDEAVIDRLPGSLEESLRVASVAGLNDAFLLLRPPRELSEGQRYRYRLAMVLAGGARVVLIDEFCSLLDRQTARAVAYRVRRYAERTGTTFILATSHDDLVEDLRPELMIRKRIGSAVEVTRQ